MRYVVAQADNVSYKILISKMYETKAKAVDELKKSYERLCGTVDDDMIESKRYSPLEFYRVEFVNGELYYAQIKEVAFDYDEPDGKVRKILTVRQLAEEYAQMIDAENQFNRNVPECDFAIIDDEPEESKTLEKIAFDARGWHGLKIVDTGFDSYSLNIVTDYYGGGSAQMTSVWDGEKNDTVVEELTKNIFTTLECTEQGHEDMKLIVEFEIKEV